MVHARRLVTASSHRTAQAIRRVAETARDGAARRARPGTGEAPRLAGDSLASLASQLDLGVATHILGDTWRADVRREDVPSLLASAADLAIRRNERAWVHVGGQFSALGKAVPSRLVRASGQAGRFRLLLAGQGDRLIENLCVEVWAPADQGSWRAIAADAPVRRIRAEGIGSPAGKRLPLDTVPQFPIDAVYTWVNAADPAWRALVAPYRDASAIDPDRFVQADEIRYSLRSLEVFAPWIRRIHVLSNCPPPPWFVASDRIRWVNHRDVIDAQYLPLFNSDAIETFLHRIPDLTEQFLYLNDDFLLAQSVFPGTFFTWDGRSIAHMLTRNSTLFMQQLVASGEAEDWESGRVNGARLLMERCGVFPTTLHQHAPYALTRSGWKTLQTDFADQVEATRRSRFRSHDGITWTAFLYHHYGLARGSTVMGTATQYEISPDTMRRLSQDLPEARTFAVVADRRGSANDPAFTAFKARFLEEHWPFPSVAERVDA